MVNTQECRVCGKAFVPCNVTSGDIKAFNYRCCACSPECGAEYLRRVLIARGELVEEKKESEVVKEEITKETTEVVDALKMRHKK